MKILINALSGNGDALMFSPALRALKEKIPSAEIDMLVMFRSVKEMYENNPFLNNIFYVNFLKQSKLKSLSEVRKISNNKYDYSINVYPANRSEYNILNALLGAKTKIAHHYSHTNFGRLEFMNDVLINEVKDRHNVLQNFDLISTIENIGELKDEEAGKMEIFISDNQKHDAEIFIRNINTDNNLLVGFHPGSSLLKNHIHKRWDKIKYAETGNRLMKDYNAKILLFGNEFDLNNEINLMMNNKAVIASTDNFMDSIARMKHCGLFISNDTAFMHSAAALDIPAAGIFAYTNARELYPWKTKNVVVRKELSCSPCFYNSPKPATCIFQGAEEFKCIKTIEVNEVMEAAVRLIG
ncbi:MAG TPA: glycosyltransferase family 9 protein [Ignavibacteria bacterium]|nr:glycosyltransferase family 9 protein [Ignavibacteria bacterium]HMR40542.1 glycosyltransferase family 9 protein [Ignavibacteria bacterium]